MRKSHRRLIVVATGLALVLASGFILATSHGARTWQRAMRIHARNSISTLTFSVSTNALAHGQSQTP